QKSGGPRKIHQGPKAFCLVLVNESCFEFGLIRRLLESTEFFSPSISQRDAKRTDFVPVGLHVAIRLQLTERGNRMHGKLDTLGRIAHLPAKTCPLRSGDLAHITAAFEEKSVGLTRFGQGISHATTDRTAADDDDFGAG